MKIEEFLGRLNGFKKAGTGYMALCPAHNDQGQSLSVKELPDKLLVHCHAGCSIESVLKAMDLSKADLFSNTTGGRQPSGQSPIGKAAKVYQYHNSKGEVVFEAVRYEPNAFRQRRHDGSGDYIYNLKGVHLVLYRLPEVIQAVKEGKTIFIPEGEKDADSLRAWGLVATTSPMGAGKWRGIYAKVLEGADCVIIRDNNEPGQRHGEDIAWSIYGKAARVRILDMPEPGIIDISDWIVAGLTLEQLEEKLAPLPDYVPAPITTEVVQGETGCHRLYALTDAGNGEAIADMWRHKIRYVFEWKSWLIYSKGCWRIDTSGYIRALGIQTMRQLFRDTASIDDVDEKKKRAGWYISSESDNSMKSMLNYTLTEPGVSITADRLDDKPWLLNAKNGTIELKTCKLRPASPEDLLTQIINTDYNPDATATDWVNFLQTVFKDDASLIDYVQRSIGYTLNGTQLERIFFFLYGLGMNGKSQFMTALRIVLGPYALEAKPELFMEKRFAVSGPDEGQAALKGIRLLSATELKKRQSLDVSLVKRMTGGEPIWHEKKYQRGYSFYPNHTLWLSGNHEPVIKDTTDSIWDRLNKIPFDIRIDAKQEIKGYGQKLAEAHSEAILAWAVAGAMAWNKRGLSDPPECVKFANAEYRAHQDVLHDFLYHVVKTAGQHTTVADMHTAYTNFCAGDDVDPLGKKTFNEAMRERGYKNVRGNFNKSVWQNVTYVTNVIDIQETFLARARVKEFPVKQVIEVTKVTEVTEVTEQSPSVTNNFSGGDGGYDFEPIFGVPRSDIQEKWIEKGRPIVNIGPGKTIIKLDMLLKQANINEPDKKAVLDWYLTVQEE